MNINELQQELFRAVKSRVQLNGSMVDDLAALLGISTDSAYRRIRGEKLISVEELFAICMHFRISFDELMNLNTGSILFQGKFVNNSNFRFEEYLTNLMNNMAYINSFKQKQLFYICKDLPIFHHYHYREIAAFKWYFWLKYYFHFPEFSNRKFIFSDYPQELYELDQKVLTLYNQIPSVEIWNIESMNIIFRQIEFSRDSDVFSSNEDVYHLYEKLGQMWTHIEEQAACGYKYNITDGENGKAADFGMYFNEVILGDNHILVILDGMKVTYITHTSINFMITRDLAYNENMNRYVQNLMQKSTLISRVSEKERSRFFRIIRERIEKRKQSLV